MKKLLSVFRLLALLAGGTILLDGGHPPSSAQRPQSRHGGARVSEAQEPVATTPGATAASSAGQQQLRVFLDPVTGQITRRSAAPLSLSAQERLALTRSSVGLQPRTLPNGGTILDLEGRFRHLLVSTSNETEKLSINCVHRAEQADACLQAGAGAARASGDEERDVR